MEEGIYMMYKPDGRLQGEAYAAFETPTHAESALKALNRTMIGNRYIEIFIALQEEYEDAAMQQAHRIATGQDFHRDEEGVSQIRGVQAPEMAEMAEMAAIQAAQMQAMAGGGVMPGTYDENPYANAAEEEDFEEIVPLASAAGHAEGHVEDTVDDENPYANAAEEGKS